jgi:hypothetical protein
MQSLLKLHRVIKLEKWEVEELSPDMQDTFILDNSISSYLSTNKKICKVKISNIYVEDFLTFYTLKVLETSPNTTSPTFRLDDYGIKWYLSYALSENQTHIDSIKTRYYTAFSIPIKDLELYSQYKVVIFNTFFNGIKYDTLEFVGRHGRNKDYHTFLPTKFINVNMKSRKNFEFKLESKDYINKWCALKL